MFLVLQVSLYDISYVCHALCTDSTVRHLDTHMATHVCAHGHAHTQMCTCMDAGATARTHTHTYIGTLPYMPLHTVCSGMLACCTQPSDMPLHCRQPSTFAIALTSADPNLHPSPATPSFATLCIGSPHAAFAMYRYCLQPPRPHPPALRPPSPCPPPQHRAVDLQPR